MDVAKKKKKNSCVFYPVSVVRAEPPAHVELLEHRAHALVGICGEEKPFKEREGEKSSQFAHT